MKNNEKINMTDPIDTEPIDDGSEASCALPKPTIPPPGFSANSKVNCVKGEWVWTNGTVAP